MKHTLKTAVLCFAILSMSLLSDPARAFAQEKFDYEAERKAAFQLIEDNKFPDALPILEKLAAANPDDAVVIERLALTLAVIAASTKKTPDQIRKDLIRARSLAEKAKQMGNDSQIVQMLLEQIPPGGVALSEMKRSPAEDALMEGEAAFSRGDNDKALEHYERAEKLDPKLYEAPLFIGDVYYKTNRIDKAGEAYARAIAINPDRETAYRYWGNVLMRSGKMNEAKEKFIEAVIADPYSRAPWQFLMTWAERNQVQLGHPRVEPSGSMSVEKDKTNVVIDANALGRNDGSTFWMFYHTTRSQWIKEKFAKEFPNEKEYRHSLREEAEALGLIVTLTTEAIKSGQTKEKDLETSIANLLKIHKAGLLEAYILLAKADAGIARDYAEYRKNNRDKLRRYLVEFVTTGK